MCFLLVLYNNNFIVGFLRMFQMLFKELIPYATQHQNNLFSLFFKKLLYNFFKEIEI